LSVVVAVLAVGHWAVEAEGQATAPTAPPTEVALSVDVGKVGGAIPGDYLGISVETQNLLPLADGTYLFRPENKALLAFFKTLGIHTLRTGGYSADNPNVAVPNDADLDSLFAFAKAADVRVSYTLRYTTDPSADAGTAKYIMDHYKGQLVCFEIGNESTMFGTYDKYKESLAGFVAALKTAECSPEITFSGPNAFLPRDVEWARDAATDFGEKGFLSAITVNAYLGGFGRRVTDPVAGRATLLSPQLVGESQKTYDTIMPAALAAKLPFRMNETNNFYGGGAKEVSETHASALWGLDYAHWWAAHGAANLNFHLGNKIADPEAGKLSLYVPFWTSTEGYHAHPLAYGMKAFDIGSHGSSVPVAIVSPEEINVTAYAVLGTDKSIMLTVINKENGDGAKGANVKLAIDGYDAVEFMTLNAEQNDLASTDTETLGGARIGDDGSWTGGWTVTTAESLPVPAGSGMVVHFRHR
jgi:hypothetical protein